MHTDEYEISLAREINVCQRVVNQTRRNLARRKARFGIDYPRAVQAADEGSLVVDPKELAAWRDDFEALPQWEQRLDQYRQALAVMRISASRF
jgi:hypothetical protein